MVRRMPTPDDVRTALDAAVSDAERATRDASGAGVIPEDLRTRHAAVLDALTRLRKRIEDGFE